MANWIHGEESILRPLLSALHEHVHDTVTATTDYYRPDESGRLLINLTRFAVNRDGTKLATGLAETLRRLCLIGGIHE